MLSRPPGMTSLVLAHGLTFGTDGGLLAGRGIECGPWGSTTLDSMTTFQVAATWTVPRYRFAPVAKMRQLSPRVYRGFRVGITCQRRVDPWPWPMPATLRKLFLTDRIAALDLDQKRAQRRGIE